MTSPLQSKAQPQNGVGCAFPIYPVQNVCAAALQLAPLIYAGIWNSGYINKTIFVVHTVSFSAMSNWRHQGSFIGEKVPDNGPFRDPFWTGMGHIAPLRDKSHTQTIHRWTKILYSLCIPRHDFITAVKGATSEQLRDRVGSVFPIYPVQGVCAAGLLLALLIYAGMWNSG